MTTTHPTTGVPAVAKDTRSSHTGWFVAAIVVLAALVALFATLWLIERNDLTTAEADLETTTEALATSQADVASLEAQVATMEGQAAAIEAELTSLAAESTVTHELHAATRALYEDFVVAIQDPNAEEISAMFSSYAQHTNAYGTTVYGADQIGEGWVENGPVTVTEPGALIVSGGGDFAVAAMTGKLGGISGLLVTRVGPAPGGGDGLVFYDMVWYSG